MVNEIGLTVAAIAMLAVSLDFHGQSFSPGLVFRIVALAGEILYFTRILPIFGAILFLLGAVITVGLWFQNSSQHPTQSRLIDVIELVAWVWMALAIH
ncbi:hypothetical protein SAMN00768000_1566 [Sulfobacillus thermosulfidooxidans DSM 9293]|uniref:Uncharacterized protein n=1 Tax=Sulfobacillus thermosulfidooxidans (strain DSM 9293 / VKM B-1269 / AT-1) TaxID=929705 RepID=A0A1W1WF03_SULTA|nr:hypothetical protein [Sulfobacillus thermosulfidooxidans]SMC04293.1 hypothetical protein SAMN00768000_1566 [Sulfobacillus thermosulfidooxidans DSM 9293]